MSETTETSSPQLPAVQQRKPVEIRVVNDPIAVLDTARFEHMQRIATVMARSNLIPDSLCTSGPKDAKEFLPLDTVIANCFLVVNQAVRWNMDPFAVAQSVSVVHGKLCYEGKLIAAVIEAKLGIRLRFRWNDKPGEQMAIAVSGTFSDGETETVEGNVADWKTTGAGSPWTPKNFRRMLAYRGTREWCRLHAPGLMLGVLSDDEIETLADESRASRARVIVHDDDPPPPPPPPALTHQPQEKIAPAPSVQASDIELAESGRHDPAEETWDDAPPPPAARRQAEPDTGGIPITLIRDPAKLEAALLGEIAQLKTPRDFLHFGGALAKASLSAEAFTRVNGAFLKRQTAAGKEPVNTMMAG